MKMVVLATAAALGVCLAQACSDTSAESRGYLHKDLSEQMDTLAVYQDAMGAEIKAGRLADAAWYLEGLDSVFSVISDQINEHHNLQRPFSEYYQKKLEKPMQGIRQSIEQNDTAAALNQYKLLVNRCNSCHRELGVLEKAHY